MPTMIPLASDLLTVLRGGPEGRPFGICQSPNRLFSFGRITIVGASSRRCPEVIIVHADKITERCKEATEIAVAAGKMSAGHLSLVVCLGVPIGAFAETINMSALPPKADIGTQSRHVRFGPEADIGTHLDDQASTRLIEPRKSILPTSTPLWRRMAYAIAMWKKVLGIVICSR